MKQQCRQIIELMLKKGDSTRHISEKLGINRTTVSAIKAKLELQSFDSPNDINGNSINYVPKQPEKFYHTKGTTVSEHRTRR